VDAVDWNEMPPGQEADFDYVSFAEGHGQMARLEAMRKPSGSLRDNSRTDLAEWLREANEPATLAASHRQYFDYALIGEGKTHPGANWVGNWYARNLKIFANLVRLAGPPDRILVVYGVGHAFLLRQFAEQSGAFRVADPIPWLKP
jgi:hypothetical protein